MSGDKNLFDPEESTGVYDVTELTFTTEALDSLTGHTHTYSSQDSDTRDTNALGVGQAEYAYLDSELMQQLGYDALETGGIGPCFGVGFIDHDSGAIALIHASSWQKQVQERGITHSRNGRNRYDPVLHGRNRAMYNMDAEFDEAILVTNAFEEKSRGVNDLGRVQNLLQNNYDTTLLTDGQESTLGVSVEGFYHPENPAMQETTELEELAMVSGVRFIDRTQEELENI